MEQGVAMPHMRASVFCCRTMLSDISAGNLISADDGMDTANSKMVIKVYLVILIDNLNNLCKIKKNFLRYTKNEYL